MYHVCYKIEKTRKLDKATNSIEKAKNDLKFIYIVT